MSMSLELAVKRLENRVAALELAAQAPYEAAVKAITAQKPPYSVERGRRCFVVKDFEGNVVSEHQTKADAQEYAEALPQF